MFRSFLILLVINTYGRGLGNPLNQSAPNGNIASSLEDLSKDCASKYVANEITTHLKECNVAFEKPYTETQFQCSLLYDITSQLCLAVKSRRVELVLDDYTAEVDVDINISDLCNSSKHWNVADLPKYPSYKESVTKLLSNDVNCGRLCGGPDLFSVNYYCKFYKWGTDRLKAKEVPIQLTGLDTKVDPFATGGDDTNTQSLNNFVSIKSESDKNQTAEEAKPIPNYSTIVNNKSTNVDELTAKISEPYSAVGEQTLTSGVQDVAPQLTSNSNEHEEIGNEDLKLTEKDKQSNVSNAVAHLEDSHQNVVPNTLPAKDVEVEGKGSEDKTIAAVDKPVIDDNKLNLGVNAEADDYPDSEEVKESGPLDLQNADDGVDPAIGDLNDPPYPAPTKPSTKTRPIPSYIGDSQRDLYPNMQEAFLDEQEDNFFPFFLTAVILVALIYILYHNKSKVLGLIVEGRQPGRRRNSRGHSYRRLDTLEQAMSSSTTAAPSKIIY